ncbi:MAG: 50S ribosomal protein L17 [Prevotellaceae bacterium]|jgi:large subunit ribosomal protein L17|nr:50S ribosomal protein L17 [Prevotellaceae bacterium]
MRHNKKYNHLSRQSGHRKALLANLASSLIMHKRIETTLAKAKALRVYVEPLVTKSKYDTTHARRTVFSYLKDKYAVSELFRNIAPKISDRPGGYTRILKIGFRQGDAADMAMMEFVDFNEAALAGTAKKETKKSTRRSRAKKATNATVIEETVTAKADTETQNKEISEIKEEIVAEVEDDATE